MLVENGAGSHVIDFHTHQLSDYQAYLIKPGQVHQVITTEKPKGQVLVFKSGFLMEHAINCRLASPGTPADALACLTLDEFNSLQSLLKSLIAELNSERDFADVAAGAWLKLLFVEMDRIVAKHHSTPHEVHASTSLIRDFFTLLDEKHQTLHKVADYAQHLSVSRGHLQDVISKGTGKSVKAVISEKIILEAKRMLLFTEKSGKEIAFDLGFDDPAHFSKFFKKETGINLTEFKASQTA
jgi:AraC-like DNA-binding protein